ncbi:MAG: hypothetical protein GX335_04065, partial [Firmicutes bacterium]|nr:hypothetical protein [Bacillota bacterium]
MRGKGCSRALALLVLTALLISGAGCRPKAGNVISGRVILSGDPKSGLAGVSVMIIGDDCCTVETDQNGSWESAIEGEVTVVPHKDGFIFSPARQETEEGKEIVFSAEARAEIDFSEWEPNLYFGAHTQRVGALAFSSDDQYLASGSDDWTIRVWRAADGQFVTSFPGHYSPVKCLVFSPDGRYLASGAKNGSIIVWEWKT